MILTRHTIIEPLAAEKEKIVKVSRSLYESWNLSLYPSLTLKCGNKQQQVSCLPEEQGDDNRIACASRLMQDFHLPHEPLSLGLSLHTEAGLLELGPIIAVLTAVGDNEFKGQLVPFCEELAQYSERKHVLFYVFTLKDWKRRSVVGYVKRHNRWDRLELPHPHVIYNRIGSRKLEQLPATERFFHGLAEKRICYFNTHFLDKWDVHEKLAAHPELHPYVPTTVLHEDRSSLQHMVERYPNVFLKPAGGSHGKNIFRVYRINDHLELDYTTFNGENERHFSTFDDLHLALKDRLRKQRFIIQQGLTLLEHVRRPLDFRMLCNKGQTGRWTITSAVARVSGRDQFVSNLARGGDLYPVNDILREAFADEHAKQIKKLLGEIALEVCNVISLESEGDFAELGVDLALDQHGKPWILEVNTKPSKDLDPERKPSTIRPSAKAVIDYGCFLFRTSRSTGSRAER